MQRGGIVRNLLVKFKKNEFLKNTSILVGGTIVAQLISILSSPVLSRIFTTEDFGLFATFMAIVGVFSNFSSLKYELAIVVEKRNDSAKRIQLLSYVIVLAFTLLFTCIIICTPYSIFKKYNLDVGNYIYILIPLVFFTGIYTIQSNVLNREKKYKSLSISGIVNKISIVFFQIVLGFFGLKLLGLVLGNLLGLAIVVFVIYFLEKKDFSVLNFLNYSELKLVANKHYRFPKFTMPQTLLNTLSQQAPIYILGYYYGLEVVGAYWMAMRIIQLPSLLVGKSIGQVYYQQAFEVSESKEKTKKLFNTTTLYLLKLTVVPVLIIFFFGKQLFIFVLGNDWELAGEFSKWMILWVGTGFITPPTMMSLMIFNKQKLNMIYDIILTVIRVVILILGGLFLSSLETIIIFSLVGFVFNFGLVVYVKYKVII